MAPTKRISTAYPAGGGFAARAYSTFARVISCFLAVMVPTMIGLICWRWMTVHEPSTAMVISGDGSLNGAIVEVSGNNHNWAIELTRDNGWQTPILLDPGPYHVKVTHHNRLIFDEDFLLDKLHGIRQELPSIVTIAGNAALADAVIEIEPVREHETAASGSALSAQVTLTKQGHYRATVPLFAGMYRVMARAANDPSRVIQQVRFTVDRTAPVRIDLTRSIADDEASDSVE